jgi:hypothetical protein
VSTESIFGVTLSEFTTIETLQPWAAGGVYACFDEDGPIYIGQTGLFSQRLKQHETKKWWPRVVRVLVFPLASLDDRLTLETLMILRHRPRHNRQINIKLRKDGTLYETQWLSQGYHKKSKKAKKK